jgi:pimeloyl-ACP methyl ester carboxylesterase
MHTSYMTSRETDSTSTTRFLARPEGRIAFELQGDGPLVVLVPGMGELRSSYRFLAPSLVSAGYRVASTDLRGHGESDTSFARYGDVETAADVTALIESLGGPAIIVGNSLAAGAGVIVAADRPELVSGLVLVGPFVRNPKSNGIQLALFRIMMAPLWVAAVWKAYLPTLYAGRKPVDFEDYRARVVASLKRAEYGKAFSLTTRQTDHAPAEARLGGVSAPALVIMGERDPDFPDPAAEAAWIGETLHAEIVMVPEAGHYPQSQQPEITTPAVIGFLGRVHHRA